MAYLDGIRASRSLACLRLDAEGYSQRVKRMQLMDRHREVVETRMSGIRFTAWRSSTYEVCYDGEISLIPAVHHSDRGA